MTAAEDSPEAQGASRAASWLCRAHTSTTLTTCSLSMRSAPSAWAHQPSFLQAHCYELYKTVVPVA